MEKFRESMYLTFNKTIEDEEEHIVWEKGVSYHVDNYCLLEEHGTVVYYFDKLDVCYECFPDSNTVTRNLISDNKIIGKWYLEDGVEQ